jgi:hypothetical protein
LSMPTSKATLKFLVLLLEKSRSAIVDVRCALPLE